MPGDVLRIPAVAGHIRVVVTGAEGTRLHEEVVVAGGTIEAGRLVRATEDDLRDLARRRPPKTARRSTSSSRLTELWPTPVRPARRLSWRTGPPPGAAAWPS